VSRSLQAQLWYRDPFNTSNQTTSLSDAIEFCVSPKEARMKPITLHPGSLVAGVAMAMGGGWPVGGTRSGTSSAVPCQDRGEVVGSWRGRYAVHDLRAFRWPRINSG